MDEVGAEEGPREEYGSAEEDGVAREEVAERGEGLEAGAAEASEEEGGDGEGAVRETTHWSLTGTTFKVSTWLLGGGWRRVVARSLLSNTWAHASSTGTNTGAPLITVLQVTTMKAGPLLANVVFQDRKFHRFKKVLYAEP